MFCKFFFLGVLLNLTDFFIISISGAGVGAGAAPFGAALAQNGRLRHTAQLAANSPVLSNPVVVGQAVQPESLLRLLPRQDLGTRQVSQCYKH